MNLEPIITAKLKRFKAVHGFDALEDTRAFELFVNYQILYSQQPDAFFGDSQLLDFISVGGSNDLSIDGIAIKTNGVFINTKEDFDIIVERSKRVEIEFIFIQSKFKKKFEMGEFNNFTSGVRDFLSEQQTQPLNNKISELIELKKYVLDDDKMLFWKSNPSVKIYYVAIGKKQELPHIDALSKQFNKDISNLNIYNDVIVNIVDGGELKKICDANDNSFEITINVIQDMGLTAVYGVDNSCILLCYASELLKLVTNDDSTLRKTIFSDNVRDFQGETTINKEIEKTICSEPEKFVLLNNGLTIVCDEFMIKNRTIKLSNPQIVNGCQTTNVLYHARYFCDISRVPLVIKVIASSNSEVTNQVVRGTNRQNIVYDEAFETTKPFHKDLEDFFESISFRGMKIYYERRSRQFQDNIAIKQHQKINFRILIQSVTGMFLNQPHIAYKHESVLLRTFQNQIFREYHSKLPYYVSSVAHYLLEDLFRNEPKQKKEFYPYKFHILMLSRILAAGDCPDINNEKEIDRHCVAVIDKIENDNHIFNEAFSVFNKCKRIWVTERKQSRFGIKDHQDFSKLLLQISARETCSIHDESQNKYKGQVIKIGVDRYGNYFGFIDRDPYDLFFHQRMNPAMIFSGSEGKNVTYSTSKDEKTGRDIAINVMLS